MRYDYFFKRALEAGIEDAELYISTSSSLSFSLFHSEIDQFTMNKATSILARGKINGKFGSAACDVWNRGKADYLIGEILRNAKVIENEDPQFIFEGSPRYRKVSTFNADLPKIAVEEKKKKLFELEDRIRNFDPRISEVEHVAYSERVYSTELYNSKGLKLHQKGDYYYFYGSAVAKGDNQVKTAGELFLDNDFQKFNVEDLATKVAESALSKLGGEECPSAVYPVVLAPEVVSDLLSAYISSADAEEIQKKSSLFIGKIGQKVASSKVTVEDRPLDKTVFARSFDDEGVATYNKAIIKNGILKMFMYNLTTAAKDGTQSTGNASRGVGKVYVSPICLCMKPGKLSQEELFRRVGNGVYITEVQGLHAGMNRQSGNFSLQSTGFWIKDGKKDRPLDMITVSGNLVKLFTEITDVGNDVRLFPSSISCPSVSVRHLNIAGK